MAAIERTDEFSNILAQLHGVTDEGVANGSKKPQVTPQSVLNNLARQISAKVEMAALRVVDLRRLTKATALFDDRTPQIQEVAFYINEDIQVLDREIAEFDGRIRSTDNPQVHQDHSVNMSGILKMHLGVVAKDAKSVHDDWCASMQRTHDRKQRISTPTVRRRPHSRPSGKICSTSEASDGAGQFRQQMGASTQGDVSRMDAVQRVQGHVAELAKMFTQTAMLVHEQQDMIARVDDDLERAHTNLDSAQTELIKYWRRVSSNRSLIYKVFGIIIAFVVFFVLFLSD